MIKVKSTQKLREKILRSGYSYSEMACKMGISRSVLGGVFRKASINPKSAKRLIEILNVDFDDYFYVEVKGGAVLCPNE